jgi:hypothetical protein
MASIAKATLAATPDVELAGNSNVVHEEVHEAQLVGKAHEHLQTSRVQ